MDLSPFLGIYGGSFDPVHFGHLLVAECCREQCGLNEVWFVPAAISPHKQHTVAAEAQHRVEMLKLAVGGHESFRVSTVEVDRGGVSYTVDTLEQIRAEEPGRELFLILGADSLADLPNWREPRRICELALPVVVRRAYSNEPDFSVLGEFMSPDRVALAEASQVSMPAVGISSTEMRERIAAGRSIRYRTPRAVEKYIETHGLYQPR